MECKGVQKLCCFKKQKDLSEHAIKVSKKNYVRGKMMNILEILMGAAALYVTDIIFAPFFGATEFSTILRFSAQAAVLKWLYSGVISKIGY